MAVRSFLPKVTVALMALSASLVAPTASADQADCSAGKASVSQIALLGACDVEGWAIETPLGSTLTVPVKGTAVIVSGLRDDGIESPSATLFHGSKGGVVLFEGDKVVAATSADVTAEAESHLHLVDLMATQQGTVVPFAVGKCDSSAPYAHIWAGYAAKNYYWYYNSSGQPSSSSLARLQGAASTIGNGTSATCGNLSNGLTTSYGGAASVGPNINSSGGCLTNDLASVVAFGAVDGTYLAWACRWTSGSGHLSHADIRFDNSSRSWYTASGTSGCSGSTWDLQGVATHEFGHAVGLNHVAADEPQVMNPNLGACNFTWRQLGRGDQNGLRALYGP